MQAQISIEEQSASLRITRKRIYIEDVINQVASQTVGRMSDQSIEDTFNVITTSDESPDILANFISHVIQPNYSALKHELIENEQLNNAPVEDFEATFSTGETSERLGCMVNTVKNRIKNLKLLGYRCHDKDEFRLPQWQIKQGKVINGVDLVLSILNENGIPAFRKFTLPLIDFEDKCIAQMLLAGDIQTAQKMAEQLKEN